MSPGINPEMIVLARESRGISQSEMARSLSITQGRLSKIEGGLLPIPETLLNKMANVLEYPIHLFSFSDKNYGLGQTAFYHRKQQRLSPKVLKTIQARINMRCINLSKLLRYIEIPNNFPRMDSDEHFGRIEKIAEAVRASWLLKPGPIKSLTSAIENAGGIVMKIDFGTRWLDAISLYPPGLPPLFFVNKESPVDRLRFTLCHELGHIIMHGLLTTDIKKIEDEANLFSGAFLMPAKDVGSSLHGLSLKKMATLKQYWKVSMAAILERAYRLGKITLRKRQYLWTQLGPYARNEPIQLEENLEEPRLLREIIETHHNELGYSKSELSKFVGLNESEFNECLLGSTPALKVV